MLFSSKLSKPDKSATIETPRQDVEKTAHDDGKSKDVSAGAEKTESLDVDGVPENVQFGVRAMEAATSVWTRSHLIAAYIMYVEQMRRYSSIL